MSSNQRFRCLLCGRNVWLVDDRGLCANCHLKQPRDPHLGVRQWHHGYFGAVLYLGSLVLVLRTSTPWHVIAGAIGAMTGILLMLDDITQHIAQQVQPGYRSPINRLWGWILRRVKR